MEFAFTQEQEELRREARAFLEANPERAAARELRELGWLGVSVPEERGGGGLSLRRRGDPLRGGRPRALLRPLPDDRGRPPGARPRSTSRRGRSRSTASCPTSTPSTSVLREDMTAVPAEGETLATDRRDAAARPARRAGRRRPSTASFEPRAPRGCSRRSRSRPSGSRRRRSSSASRTSPTASSSARRSAPTRPSRIRSPTRYVETELARSLAYWAAWCVAEDDERGAGRGRRREVVLRPRPPSPPASASIQVHGGIGFTWEHVLHRYYKRAQWIDAFGGHAAEQREVVAAALLD